MKEYSEDEKMARDIADIAMRNGASIQYVVSVFEKNRLAVPSLSEAECMSIAYNYPCSFGYLRQVFDKKGVQCE